MFLVKEKSENIKHQQIVSGVSVKAYWFSNYLMDTLKYWIPAFWCVAMSAAFNITNLISSSAIGMFFLLNFLFGFAMISFTYLMTFAF